MRPPEPTSTRGSAGGLVRGLAVAVAVVALVGACRPIGMLGEPSLDAKQVPGHPAPTGQIRLLTDVRAWRHHGFERVVLEFTGEVGMSWRVTYAEPPILELGRGWVVPVAGGAILSVHVTPASDYDLSGSAPLPSYVGPSRFEPTGEGVVTEVVSAGAFEADLAWAIGLRERVPFSVTELADPTRLVIDVLAEG
jgi:hypothetical protein